ncbi:putative odorant receptor 85e [Andrena cerasifolii]|uniref:putative odorant receptor 85e n=1 Tax=Andrena cerasifolii TaxID=2819439 RepID=UPI004037C8D0
MYIFAITVFVDICANMDKLSVATDDGCVYAGIVVVIFKTMNYQIRRAKITRLIEEALKCADDLSEFTNVVHAKIVKDIIERCHMRNKVIFYGFGVLGCLLGIALLFFSPMKNGLPIRATYPFNMTISPWHEIGISIESCAVCAGVMAIVSIDSITILICSMITMEFDILSVNFENCGKEIARDVSKRGYSTAVCVSSRLPGGNERVCDKNIARDDERRTGNTFVHRYKTCIRFHQRLVSMTNDYNETYSSSMCVQMLSSTSIICLTGFQAVVVGGQSSDVIKFGIFLNAAISQLLYICWVGNELSYSSSVLDKSQWFSGWNDERSTDIVQVFALSTMFARQSIELKAGTFYILSLQTFIAIVRRSYSVYTLLNNIHSENS